MSIFDVYVSVNRFGDKCYKFNEIAISESNKVDSPFFIFIDTECETFHILDLGNLQIAKR